jgi:hypothetical protein
MCRCSTSPRSNPKSASGSRKADPAGESVLICTRAGGPLWKRMTTMKVHVLKVRYQENLDEMEAGIRADHTVDGWQMPEGAEPGETPGDGSPALQGQGSGAVPRCTRVPSPESAYSARAALGSGYCPRLQPGCGEPAGSDCPRRNRRRLPASFRIWCSVRPGTARAAGRHGIAELGETRCWCGHSLCRSFAAAKADP